MQIKTEPISNEFQRIASPHPESRLSPKLSLPSRRLDRSTIDAFLLSVLAAVSVFARQIIHFDDESYRNFFEPPPYYRLAILLDIAILATIAFALGMLIRRSRLVWLQRMYTRLFFLVIGSALMSTLPIVENYPWIVFTLWGLLALYLFVTWLTENDTFVQPFKRACLIFTPAAPLVVLQLANWHEFSPPPTGSSVAKTAAKPTRPIFIFLFDEWSYLRTFSETLTKRPNVPNFQSLAAQSFQFQNAVSENRSTAYSIPHLLFQTKRKLDFRNRQFVLEGDVNIPVTGQTPSLLKMAHDHGYRTSIVGWHLPYGKLFGDQVDDVRTPKPWPAISNFGGSMIRAALENLRYSYDPLFRIARRLFIIKEAKARANYIEDNSLEIIAESKCNDFIFFHFSIPHDPFIFRSNGSSHHFLIDDTPESYIDQIEYTDKVVGRLINRIKAQGAFDQAMIIMMSDHAWRNEVDPKLLSIPQAVLRVPLLIKWPGQTQTYIIDQQFITTRIGPLIQLEMEDGSLDQAQAMIERLINPNWPGDKKTKFNRSIPSSK